jgi:conjugal transfer pilus assembly protein TraA
MQMITLMQRKGTIISMAAVFGAAALVLADASFAGTGGGEFDDVWFTLEEWTQGTLGRIITLAIIVVGAVIGVVRQSLMTFAVGFAMGMGLYNAPLIIDSIVGATLTNAGAIITTGQQITNGLGL